MHEKQTCIREQSVQLQSQSSWVELASHTKLLFSFIIDTGTLKNVLLIQIHFFFTASSFQDLLFVYNL